EGVPQPMPSVPQDLESREATVSLTFPAPAFFQEEQARLCGQWKVQRLCCLHLAHLVASAWKEPEAVAPAPGTGGEFVCGESDSRDVTLLFWLQSSFMDLPRDKVDGKQQVEKLELGFIQLSGATDGEYITVYESQRAGPNMRHQEEEASRLAQKEEEMKVKLLELQDMVLPVVGDHEGHDKFLPAAQNPVNESAPGAPAPQELGAVEEQGDFHSMKPAPGQAREGSPRDSPTALKILQLLPVTQDTQEHPGLASKPCMPFFYRAAKNREINIIII
uniref:Golgin subfamily A conserved domain-containing protein n=1 Tax=Theropithecus gelada TaxID=9565 RepID=A0A8D2E6N4_THEGE